MAYMERKVKGRANHVLAQREKTFSPARKRIEAIQHRNVKTTSETNKATPNRKALISREKRYAEIEGENARLLQRMSSILVAPRRPDVGGSRPWGPSGQSGS